jgi:hypothetical protein
VVVIVTARDFSDWSRDNLAKLASELHEENRRLAEELELALDDRKMLINENRRLLWEMSK